MIDRLTGSPNRKPVERSVKQEAARCLADIRQSPSAETRSVIDDGYVTKETLEIAAALVQQYPQIRNNAERKQRKTERTLRVKQVNECPL